MTLTHPFSAPPDSIFPVGFDSPFCNSPSPYAEQAARDLQTVLKNADDPLKELLAVGVGRMFGVLVVRDIAGVLSCLHGFSGQLADRWLVPGFVPPAFDMQQREQFLPPAMTRLTQLQSELKNRRDDPAFLFAKQQLLATRESLTDNTRLLQARLVQRKAARRSAREQASAEQLVDLQREGEADARRRAEDKRKVREELAPLELAIASHAEPIRSITAEVEELQRHIQTQIQAGYSIHNACGESSTLAQLFEGRMVLDGIGDCAGPKLLNYAYSQGMTPIALAEFWWGQSPADGIRHHAHFYPSCRGRCAPLLAFMLDGLTPGRQPEHLQPFDNVAAPTIVFEDKHLLLVNKPAGQLSVPGLATIDSVQSRLQARYPDLPELQLVHRLDQSTSGLLLVAKTRRDHKALQRQFAKRTISKQYIALLDGELKARAGDIELPLRVDLEDRPRQLVCAQHGREAKTHWKVLCIEKGQTRVQLFPVTGRTHQLRVHMAHPSGLGLPIVGDELYGKPGQRLHLHAQSLSFVHPASGEHVSFTVPAPF